jgi:hypothetical protein
MEILYLLPCDYASIDSKGKLSASGIFDKIVKSESKTVLTMYIVGSIKTKLAPKTIDISILKPNKQLLSKATLSDGGGSKNIEENINFFAKFTFEVVDLGNYSVEIKFNDPNESKELKNFFKVLAKKS